MIYLSLNVLPIAAVVIEEIDRRVGGGAKAGLNILEVQENQGEQFRSARPDKSNTDS